MLFINCIFAFTSEHQFSYYFSVRLKGEINCKDKNKILKIKYDKLFTYQSEENYLKISTLIKNMIEKQKESKNKDIKITPAYVHALLSVLAPS